MVRPRTKIFIGKLLATLPLWEINLRSKVVVFWKALLMLYVTALSVRHLSPKPGGAPHLKNVSQIPIFFGWPCFGSPDGTHYHMLSLPPNSTKIAEFFLAPAGGLTVHSPPTGWWSACVSNQLALCVAGRREPHPHRRGSAPFNVWKIA